MPSAGGAAHAAGTPEVSAGGTPEVITVGAADGPGARRPAMDRPRVLRTVAEYRRASATAHRRGDRVGVVPTMGALHAGHRALVERAASECQVVVVTVFVNPTQFEEAADLADYPRSLDTDLEVAAEAGATLVFAPSDAEMYPGGLRHDPLPAAVLPLTRHLEGAFRPGHFDGVATVVPRLLAPAGRCRAYFGEKDFQQLAIVRRLVAGLDLPVEVVGCETVRDDDGLALSSRNVRLSPDERRAALALPRSLGAGAGALAGGATGAGEVVAAMEGVLSAEPLVDRDYSACVRADTLEPAGRIDSVDEGVPLRLLVAARVGPVRLIDNLDPRAPLPRAVAAGRTLR